MASLGTLFAIIGADNTQLLRATRQSALSVQKMSKSISTSLLTTGKSIESFGKAMTLGLTLPIVAAGAGMIKLASDAEETSSKFATVFKSVGNEANAMANELRNSFGLSRLESKRLLANTGDLLTGFGFTGEAALDLSSKVNRLAVDLASFTNLEGGSKRASIALTKALIGERESAKELGIAILEADVKAEVARMTAKGLTFATERQAKAYATLNIALSQSKNAIGDFARTQASVANQARIFTARLSDLAVMMGNFLLPLANKLLVQGIRLVNMFAALDPQMQANIIVLAGIIAAIGPLTFLVGKFISIVGLAIGAFGAMAGAVAFLLSPIGLLVVAFVAVVAILIKTGKATELLGKTWVILRTTLALALSGIGTVLKSVSSLVANFLRGIQVIARVAGLDLPKGMQSAIIAIDNFGGKMEEFSTIQTQAAVDVASNWGNAWGQFKGDMEEALIFAETLAAEKGAKLTELLANISQGLNIQPGGDSEAAGGAITPGPGSEEEQMQLDTSVSAWQNWLTEQSNIAQVWKDTWSQTAVNVAEGFAKGFADMIVAGRSFKSVIGSLMRSIASDLITQVVRSAIARLAVDQTVTAANAAAAAPNPFLIPLFVGIGLAAFASAIGGTEGSSMTGTPGGGGGGGGPSTAGTGSASLAVSAVTGAQPNQPEEGEGAVGNNTPKQTVIVQINRETIIEAVVSGTRDGEGDGVKSLALAEG